MRTPITVPDLGLNHAFPLTLSFWYAEPGDLVFEGDRLVELLTSGATFDLPSPATGCLVDRFAFPRDLLTIGQTLGTVEGEEDAP